MLSHVLALIVGLTTGLGVLVHVFFYLMWREKSTYVAYYALQGIFWWLACLVIGFLFGILVIVTFGLGILLLVPLILAVLYYTIMVIMKANAGEMYDLPFAGKLARQNLGL